MGFGPNVDVKHSGVVTTVLSKTSVKRLRFRTTSVVIMAAKFIRETAGKLEIWVSSR